MSYVIKSAAICLLIASCSTETVPAGALPDEIVTTVSSEITALEPAPSTITWPSSVTVTAIASASGTIVVGASDGVYRVGPAGLEPMPVYAEGDDPLETGAVTAMVEYADGVLIFAEAGVFHTYLDRLLVSPLSGVLADLEVRDASVRGDDLWIAADGLYRVNDEQVEQLTLDGQGAPTAVAASDRIVIAYPDGLVELDAASYAWYRLPDVFGTVVQAAGGDRVWLAESGIARREADGAWIRDALSGAAITAVTAGYAATDTSVIEVERAVSLGPISGALGIAIDGFGNVWAATSGGVTGFLIGDNVSFATDVAPLLGATCGGCHADGYLAPRHDFTDYATVVSLSDAVLERVTTGQMPPQGMPGLDADQLDTLTAWLVTGMQE